LFHDSSQKPINEMQKQKFLDVIFLVFGVPQKISYEKYAANQKRLRTTALENVDEQCHKGPPNAKKLP